jgi:arylsulfatase
VGRDSSDAVSSAYASPADLTGASVLQVEINLSDDQYTDLEQEAMAALARE